jgi:S1-C subfamily serine protease
MQNVDPGGAAGVAGLQPTRRGLTGIIPGDVVVTLEGRQIKTVADLSNALDQYQV